MNYKAIRTKQCKYNIKCKCNNVFEYNHTLLTQNKIHRLIITFKKVGRVGEAFAVPELEVAGLKALGCVVHEAGQETPDVLLNQAVNLVTLGLGNL